MHSFVVILERAQVLQTAVIERHWWLQSQFRTTQKNVKGTAHLVSATLQDLLPFFPLLVTNYNDIP